MRTHNRQNAASNDRARGRHDLDWRVEDVTRRSLDEMVCTLARQANERFVHHA